jgi:hypothetical protein
VNWKDRVTSRISELNPSEQNRTFLWANVEAIGRILLGQGPDSDAVIEPAGARIVYNISSAHIASFIKLSQSDDVAPYKNGYDLKKYRIGDEVAPQDLPARVIVDQSLPEVPPESIYFGAVELNGPGIRFYGDFCLVLKCRNNSNPTILDRNSYDLIRSPFREQIEQECDPDGARKAKAKEISGGWNGDLPHIATLKTLASPVPSERRLTTGRVSESILHDEDYIEVLRKSSFNVWDLQEVRVSASDAAYENNIAERLHTGRCPSAAALQWRHRRRRAEFSLHVCGVETRIVTTPGRVR